MIKSLFKLTVVQEMSKALSFGTDLIKARIPCVETSSLNPAFWSIIEQIDSLCPEGIYSNQDLNILSLGYKHFEYEGIKFLANIRTEKDKHEVVTYLDIVCFSSRKNLSKFLDYCASIFSSPPVFSWNSCWSKITNAQSHKTFDNVYCREDIKEELKRDLDAFINSKEKYYEQGITYKRNYLFVGPPGTGKTSLAKAIATYLKRPLYIFPVNDKKHDGGGWNADVFVDGLAWIGSKPVILVEDIEYAIDRDVPNTELLSFFDGIKSVTDSITIIVTNDVNKIPPTLIRPGRIDRTFFIDQPGIVEIGKLIEDMCPERFTNVQKDFIHRSFHISEIQNYLIQDAGVEKILDELNRRMTNE